MHLTQIAQAAKKVTYVSWPTAGTASSIAAIVSQPVWLNDVVVNSAWSAIAVGTASFAVWVGAITWPQAAGTTHRVATSADLPRLSKLAQRYFGKKITGIDRLRQWMERNPRVIELVTRARAFGLRDLVTIDGYYCALPLNDKAGRDVMTGARSVNEVMPEEICRPNEVPFAIYVGAIACGTGAGKAVALQGLVRLVESMAHRQRNVVVLARPVTADGMRLVGDFGLQPAQHHPDSPNPMGWVHTAKLSSILKHLKDRR